MGHPAWGPTATMPEPPPHSQQQLLTLLILAIAAIEAGVAVGYLFA
jgi:NADH:ubiquinone oxidoreductase subunit K